MAKKITEADISKILSTIYEKTKSGIPYVSQPVEQMSQGYLKKYPDKSTACKKMLNAQITKCTTSGFITGFGGLITMPVTIPANLSSVLYVQMRMIACAASMGGYDLNDDEVQTFVYACLAGVSVNQVVKRFGIQFGQKLAKVGVQKIPGKVLIKINQRIGFRLFTKFGEKGLINIGKMIPVVGAVINGGLDLAETKAIANRAYKMFIKNDFSVGKETPDIDLEEPVDTDGEEIIIEDDAVVEAIADDAVETETVDEAILDDMDFIEEDGVDLEEEFTDDMSETESAEAVADSMPAVEAASDEL